MPGERLMYVLLLHPCIPDVHHRPCSQAAKEGCLNIVRQADKAGIKQIVVISSVGALALLATGIIIKAPLTSNGMRVHSMFIGILSDWRSTVGRLV
jgi:hypothetical protein